MSMGGVSCGQLLCVMVKSAYRSTSTVGTTQLFALSERTQASRTYRYWRSVASLHERTLINPFAQIGYDPERGAQHIVDVHDAFCADGEMMTHLEFCNLSKLLL